VYKNPKKRKPDASNKGGSAMQPAASALDGTGVKLMKGEVGISETAVNGENFLKKKSGDVPVDLVG
jgi:ribosome biogenesis protein MAK21